MASSERQARGRRLPAKLSAETGSAEFATTENFATAEKSSRPGRLRILARYSCRGTVCHSGNGNTFKRGRSRPTGFIDFNTRPASEESRECARIIYDDASYRARNCDSEAFELSFRKRRPVAE